MALKIRRDQTQELTDRQLSDYEEKRAIWERKLAKYENSPKKLLFSSFYLIFNHWTQFFRTRDAKHREIFEKTFSELKKLREEKERNNRVERSRFSLSQGTGNSNETTNKEETSADNEFEVLSRISIWFICNIIQSADAKARSAAIIVPLCTNPPRRFFENRWLTKLLFQSTQIIEIDFRNGLVENALTESRSQRENFMLTWSDAEKTRFIEKIGIYGKNFAAIAAYIPSKV